MHPQPAVEPMEEGEHHSWTRYLVVWLALLVLTAITYAVSRLHLGPWSIAVAMAVAVLKAGLVVLFFMHLWEQQGVNRLVFAVSALFVALLIGLSIADLATRARIAL